LEKKTHNAFTQSSGIRVLLLLTILFGTAVFARLNYVNGMPGAHQWTYNVLRQWSWKDPVFFILGILLVYSGWRWAVYGTRRAAVIAVILFVVFSISAYSLVGLGFTSLPSRFLSLTRSGPIKDAMMFDSASDLLSRYSYWLANFSIISKTHPPGHVLMFKAVSHLTELFPEARQFFIAIGAKAQIPRPVGTSDKLWATTLLWTYLSPLAAMSAAVPIYMAARRKYDKKTAAVAVILYGLLPCQAFFYAYYMPFLTMICAWTLALMVMGHDGKILILIAGFLSGLLIFINYGMMAWAALLLLYHYLERMKRTGPGEIGKSSRALAFETGMFFVGVLLPWIPCILNPDYQIIALFKESMAYHESITGDRPRAPWLLLNLWDLAMFQNIAVVYFFMHRTWGGSGWLKVRDTAFDPMARAALITVVLLDLSMITSGEVGRIWMFVSPLVIIPASAEIARLKPKQSLQALFLIFACFAIVIIGFYSH
jgi:hypothetical protein